MAKKIKVVIEGYLDGELFQFINVAVEMYGVEMKQLSECSPGNPPQWEAIVDTRLLKAFLEYPLWESDVACFCTLKEYVAGVEVIEVEEG